MAQIKEFSGADLNTISRFGGVSNTLEKINGVTVVAAASFTGLLDTYTGAAAAFSTRRLYSLYTGAALRVREDATDTETDIGFDSNGDLDTAAIASHCGSANGYVTKWYGQESSGGTGSGKDAAQATHGSQPQIYNGSSVVTLNGNPAIYTAGGCNLNTGNVNIGVSGDIDIDFFGVLQNDSANGTTSSGLFGLGVAFTAGTDRRRVYCFSNDSATLKSVRLYGGNTVVTSSATGQVVFNTNYQGGGGAFDVRFDGAATSVSSFSNTGLNMQQNTSVFCLFSANSSNGGAEYADSASVGYIQEVVYYLSDQGSTNRSGIEGNQNAHFQIGNFGTPTSGLLATYTGAAAAYSVRQLANTAALAMRVREDGTDTELDIGFDANGDLDTAAISSHCGSNNGYVVTWYDQSGNQVDATQGTSGKQPQIYNGTAVITENGKPILEGSTSSLNISYNLNTGSRTIVAVRDLTAQTKHVFMGTNNGIPDFFLADESGSTDTAINSNVTVSSIHKNGASYTLPSNRGGLYTDLNSQSLLYMIASFSFSQTNTCLGYRDAIPPGFGMHSMQELIIYPNGTTPSRTGIETNVNGYFSIY